MTTVAVEAAREHVVGKSNEATRLHHDLLSLEPSIRREFLSELQPADWTQVLAVSLRESGSQFALWADDPVGFLEDVLGERTWSIPNRILSAIPTNRRIAVPSSFSTSKTWSIARAVLWHSMVFPVGTSKVITIAAKFSQVSDIIWPEIRGAHARAGLPGHCDVTQMKMQTKDGIDFVVAKGIAAAPHNEAAVQGHHAPHLLLVVDEAGGMGHRVGRNLNALLSADGTSMVAIGNPPTDDEGSWFETYCEDPKVLTIAISALSTPNFTGEVAGRCLSCPSEMPRHPLSQHLAFPTAVEEIKDLHGEESPYYQAKVLARFPKGGPSQALPASWVDAALNADEPEGPTYIRLSDLGLPDEDTDHVVMLGAWCRLGVDVAADGGDEFVIARAVGNLVTVEHASSGAANADPMAVAGKVLEEIRRTEMLRERLGSAAPIHVKIDVIGVGWGVVGVLEAWRKEAVHSAIIVPVDVRENTNRDPDSATLRPARKRDEMWLAFRSLLAPKVEALRLRVDRRTAAQLRNPTYSTNMRGETVIESKDSMKARGVASPDRGEACLLAVYEPAPSKGKRKKARVLA